jgi:hypothetical protein
MASDVGNRSLNLFSFSTWANLSFLSAGASLSTTWKEFYELIALGKTEAIGVIVMAMIVALGLVFLGFFLRSLTKVPPPPPDGWRTIKPGSGEVVGDEKQAIYVKSELDATRFNILTGSSGAGKSTILREHLPILAKNDDKAHVVFVEEYSDVLRSLSLAAREVNSSIPDISNALLRKSTVATGERDEDSDLRTAQELASRTANNPGGKRVFVILDQFESVAAAGIKNLRLARLYQTLLKGLIQPPNVTVCAIVRKEWLADAQQLADILGIATKIIVFPQRDPLETLLKAMSGQHEVDSKIVSDWVDFYKKGDVDEQTAQLVMTSLLARPAGLLQIEARMVYVVLATKFSRKISDDDFRRCGEIEGLIASYFETVLRAAPNENVASKILVALISDRRGLRMPKTMNQISLIIHEDLDATTSNVNHLRLMGMVRYVGASAGDREEESVGYILEHDYISEYVATSSTLPMKAEDRDNIGTLASRVARDRALKQLIPYVAPAPWTIGRILICVYILAAFCVFAGGFIWHDELMATSAWAYDQALAQTATGSRFWTYLKLTARGFDPIWFKLGSSTASTYHGLLTISIAAVQLLFMFYVDFFYRGFLHVAGKREIKRVEDLRAGNAYRYILVFAIIASIYTLFAKQYFLFWPAIGGVLLGLAQVRMSKHPGLSEESRKEIGGVGKKGALNIAGAGLSLTTLIVGVNYLALFEIGWPLLALLTYLIPAILMVIFVMQIWNRHASRESLSRRRAFYDRVAYG